MNGIHALYTPTTQATIGAFLVLALLFLSAVFLNSMGALMVRELRQPNGFTLHIVECVLLLLVLTFDLFAVYIGYGVAVGAILL